MLAAHAPINWPLVLSSTAGTVVSVSVIVGGLRSAVKRWIGEVVNDCIRPHVESDEKTFTKITDTLSEIQGELKGLSR